jgi:mannose-6-phosphate isomerase-like protein (cupin superfamily)
VNIEPLPVDARFWPRLMAGALGDFHNEYLVTCHRHEADWPTWERHPAGDEVVALLDGAVTLVLETPAGRRHSPLRVPGDFVRAPRGTWHTARVPAPATLLFITAGEGTQHRPVADFPL